MCAGAWKHPTVIHIAEARTSLLSLRRQAVQQKHRRTVMLSAGDNLSEISAIDKGRARDKGLNRICRHVAAWSIGAEVTRRRRHIEFYRSPTDAASRLADRGALRAGQIVYGVNDSRLIDDGSSAFVDALFPVGLHYWELFAGCGRQTSAFRKLGYKTLVPFDIIYGGAFDLLV